MTLHESPAAGTHQPAGAPAGHRVRLRQTSQGDHPFRQARRESRNVAVGSETRVDLIGDQPEVVLLREFADGIQLRIIEYDAARIVWCGHTMARVRSVITAGSAAMSGLKAPLVGARTMRAPDA